MLRFSRGFSLFVFGAVVLAVVAYLVSRWMPVPRAEADALALVEAPRPMVGRNGFAALWALKYEIAVVEAERLLAHELVRFDASPVWTDGNEVPPNRSVLDDYPMLEAEADAGMLCRTRGADCLQQVRMRLDALVPVMASRSALEARVAALDDYDYFRNPFPARPDMPLPAFQSLLHAHTAHAYAYALGDHEAGLRGVCRNASIARKMVASGDNLIGGVLGVALMDASADLFIEMLAELPVDRPLPDACEDAFRPDGAMIAGLCPTMIGEGKFALGTFRVLNAAGQPWHRKLKTDLFLDQHKTMAMGARRHAWFCGPQAEALVRADVSLDGHAPLHGGWTFACLGNPVGCTLDNIAAPSLAGYAERFQDAEARLRVVAAWRTLRAQRNDERPLVERLDEWQKTHAAGRRIRVRAGGDGLEIDLLNDRQGSQFSLPLSFDGMGGRPR